MFFPSWAILPLGPVIGSWLGVLIKTRLGRAGLRRRSACESCGQNLGAADLVPIFSFLALRGRCRYCGAAIGWFPLAVELAAFAVGVAAFAADRATPAAWIDAALGWALLTAAWIDAETFLLPDIITLPLILAGLAVTYLSNRPAIYDHTLAATLGYTGFRVLNEAYSRLRGRDGLGAGDAKLLAAGGAWLGVLALPNLILVAALLGIAAVVLRRLVAPGLSVNHPIPFGPALALALFCLRLAA